MMQKFNIRPGDPVLTKESRETDDELDKDLARLANNRQSRDIEGITPEVHRRWVFATAALTMYDELTARKGDVSEYRLEMRKLILDGVRVDRNTPIPPEVLIMSQRVSQSSDRSQLLASLNEYLGTTTSSTK